MTEQELQKLIAASRGIEENEIEGYDVEFLAWVDEIDEEMRDQDYWDFL